MAAPGRSCPASYRYGPRSLAGEPVLVVDSLWVAGGLYGNPLALEALLEAYGRDRGAKALVFNGDFHWFDVDANDFELINEAALAFDATRGNVETELAAPHDGAGCGCGYPEWVDEGTVRRSNRILERLRRTAARFPMQRIAALPMHLTARVAAARIAIVHGDADSLAGWGFSQEALSTSQGLRDAAAAVTNAGADVIACSHTCLPVLQPFAGGQVLINNGAAGMPNFRGEIYGLATRISVSPWQDVAYGTRRQQLFIDAVPLRYDAAAWERRFLEQWPAGTDAHRSYYGRIVNGPAYRRCAARRAAAPPRHAAASRACRGA